jgi:hypothetical protein
MFTAVKMEQIHKVLFALVGFNLTVKHQCMAMKYLKLKKIVIVFRLEYQEIIPGPQHVVQFLFLESLHTLSHRTTEPKPLFLETSSFSESLKFAKSCY